ncbi:IS3 family transposase [Defluviimonas sp. SAOS-178_SWC]|uniref:IS3 family transposase n=1 Tax=Defluviimonas sp. SAOS-178_SWC TaxID=3121287 RepID=UPI0032218C58
MARPCPPFPFNSGHARLAIVTLSLQRRFGAQCRLLSIWRSSFYCAPQGETGMNLALMQLIDRQFLETPFYGAQLKTWHLQKEGHPVNQKRIRRLIRLMRLMPIHQKPNTSKPARGHTHAGTRAGRYLRGIGRCSSMASMAK